MLEPGIWNGTVPVPLVQTIQNQGIVVEEC